MGHPRPRGPAGPEWRNYGPESGLTDPEHYALDASHPGVVEYLRVVFRTLRFWGATVFKTDFLDWGLKDTERVARHDLTRTSVEAFRSVLQMIREEIGEDTTGWPASPPTRRAWASPTACGSRTTPGPSWSEGSQGNMIQETIASHYFNNVFWQNDPDCVVLRDERTHLALTRCQALALWSGILGGTVTLLRHAAPAAAGAAGPLALPRARREGHGDAPVPGEGPAPEGGGAPLRRASGVGRLLSEPGGRAVTGRFDIASLVGETEAFVWEWGPGRASALGKRRDLVVETAGHAGALYYVSLADTPPPADLTIGGKRGS